MMNIAGRYCPDAAMPVFGEHYSFASFLNVFSLASDLSKINAASVIRIKMTDTGRAYFRPNAPKRS
jgi:hypothetical protein